MLPIALNAGSIALCHNHIIAGTTSCMMNSPIAARIGLIHSHAAVNAPLIASHAPSIKFLKPSDLFHNTTNAATSAAIPTTMRPSGFASQAAFCAQIAAVVALTQLSNPPAAIALCAKEIPPSASAATPATTPSCISMSLLSPIQPSELFSASTRPTSIVRLNASSFDVALSPTVSII